MYGTVFRGVRVKRIRRTAPVGFIRFYRFPKSPHTRRRQRGFRAICLVCAVLICIISADIKLNPIVKTTAEAVINNRVAVAINKAVIDVMSSETDGYGLFVKVETDANGRVMSVRTNTAELNRIRGRLTEKIAASISPGEKSSVGIPWGTLTGITFLSGRGSRVNFSYTVYGFTLSDIKSEFISAGINQTLHRISAEITVRTRGFVALSYVGCTVVTSAVLAETVIVGEVPDAYFNLMKE